MTHVLPSSAVPEHEKRGYSEAEVHTRLFEADMHMRGYPSRTNTQADGGSGAPSPGTSQLFLLGYLNSSLATYFMRKIVNTTATADVGYLEKLPYRRPTDEIERDVVDRVRRIIAARDADPESDIRALRDQIDEGVFDLFEIEGSREEIRGLYRRAAEEENPGQAAEE